MTKTSMTFAEALRAAMKQKDLKQVDICRATGLSDAYVSMLVGGKIDDPKWSKAVIIIQALGLTLDEFSQLKAKGTIGE